MKDALTKKQQEIYDFIVSFQSAHSYPPTIREIATSMQMKSPSTVHFHLKGMKEKGVLHFDAGKTRAITIGQPAQRMPKDRVPLMGHVAAGTPIFAQENIEEYLLFDTHGREEEYFALTVRGDSMRDAGILSGDYIIVHHQSDFHNGEIVVALFEDEATVKTYQMNRGRLWLLPENPDYKPIDGKGCQLLGKVVGVQRRY